MANRAPALLVYSHPFPVGILKASLRRLGVATASCNNCAKLETALRVVEPQLVFTDLKLANGRWLDVLMIVRANMPKARVIIFGPIPDPRFDVTVKTCGAWGYMAPPFEQLRSESLLGPPLPDISVPRLGSGPEPAA